MMMIATDDNYFHFQFELYVHSTLQTRLCFVNVYVKASLQFWSKKILISLTV